MKKTIEIPEGYEARIEGNKIILEPKESEDERIRKEMLDFFKQFYDIKNVKSVDVEPWIVWLEKQGEQILANSEKTCKDEQKSANKIKIYDSMDDLIADALIEEIEGSELHDRDKYNRIHWIKSHRQNPVWSEEDEEIINNIGEYLNRYGNYIVESNEEKAGDIYKSADWITSLKERTTWKPNDEQMHYLSWIANIKLGDSIVEQEVSKHLNELYDDLKKLKG